MSGFEIAAILMGAAVLVAALAWAVRYSGFYCEVELENPGPPTQPDNETETDSLDLPTGKGAE